jgi:DNA-binding protein H-NS
MKVTEEEKKLLQAKHRLEEAQMRDRVRERKARTRRLIQEGAVFEKHFPAARHMELDELDNVLREIFS